MPKSLSRHKPFLPNPPPPQEGNFFPPKPASKKMVTPWTQWLPNQLGKTPILGAKLWPFLNLKPKKVCKVGPTIRTPNPGSSNSGGLSF